MFESPSLERALAKIIERPKDLQRSLAQKVPAGRVVLVKGVYDLLHIGHFYSFARAKDFGDVLVVAVNADKAVQNRKGVQRPIINQNDRMVLIAAFECVDWVTLYEEESPYDLIKVLRPAVFAASHFASVSAEQRLELEQFTIFQTLPRIGPMSTSEIVLRILES
jgi:rfaE bifunctional protein nucleotidyltransferase chain/domain